MKLFKKLAAALLALTMVASMAACGSSSGSSAAEAAKSDAPAAAASEAGSAPAAAAGDVDVNAAMSGKTIGYVTINGAAPWGGLIGTKLDEFVKAAGGTCKILDAQTDTARSLSTASR